MKNVYAIYVLAFLLIILTTLSGEAFCESSLFSDDERPSPTNHQSVVEIIVYSIDEKGSIHRATGSGVWVSQRNMILTSAHLVNDAQDIFTRTSDGEILRAFIYKVSSVFDVAVLIPEKKLPIPAVAFVPIDEKKDFQRYTSVYYGSSKKIIKFSESVTIKEPVTPVLSLFHLDIEVVPGASGGGVFDGRDNLLALILGGIFEENASAVLLSARVLAVLVDDLEEILYGDLFSMQNFQSSFGSISSPGTAGNENVLTAVATNYWHDDGDAIESQVQQLLKKYPDKKELHVLRAFVHVKKGDAERGYRYLYEKAENKPSGMLYFFLGKIAYEFLKQKSESIFHYEKALKYIQEKHSRDLILQRIRVARLHN